MSNSILARRQDRVPPASSDNSGAKKYPVNVAYLTQVAVRIVDGVPRINRETFDITSKLSGTIEWE